MQKYWTAKWIMDPAFRGHIPVNVFHKEMSANELPEHDPDLKNHHMLVRKKFNIDMMNRLSKDESSSKYMLDISADDYYKVYINGHFIGQGPAPSYPFHYAYNQYDVSDYLQTGENIIAVHVYYQGLINRVWNSGDYRQGLIAELSLGQDLLLATDSTWTFKKAAEFTGTTTYGYETQYSEDIDNRQKDTHWKDLNDQEENWQQVYEQIADDHKLVLQQTPPLAVYEINPVKVEALSDGHYFIDFGQEITGQFKCRAKGIAGQMLTIRCGEELEDASLKKVRFAMRCNCTYEETWTLAGVDDVLELYDYKAFRYVEVICPQDIELGQICAVVRHYPLNEESCIFTSSNELLNSIWSICKNGVKYGAQEVFVDCPSREKGQYLGDATVTSLSHLYLSGDLRLVKKCLHDFALSTYICPGIMAVAPGSFMQEIADFSLQWPYQLYHYYMHSNDLAFLRAMFPIAEGVLTYFKKYEREDGLLEHVTEKWNLVDWPDNLRDSYDFELSKPIGEGCHNVINAFYYGAVTTLNKIKTILNIDFVDESEPLKMAFLRAFYNEESKLFCDSTSSSHSSLHANFLPLFWGLVPEKSTKSVVSLIRERRLNCGVYNAFFLLKGLAKAGAYDLLFELLTSNEEHSWGNMVREGATTCFEAWGKEQKWNTSLCHPWASAPISVLIEDVMGIKPRTPGWEIIEFSPHIPESLEYMRLEFETIKGRIKMEWKDGHADLWVPEGCTVVNE